MKTVYEWCLETINEDGDILENNFSEVLDFDKEECNSSDKQLVLVRREGDETEGEQDRLWAYVKDGKLPETFSDSAETPISINVPKRFHKELEKYLITN